jgi:hypothetical protein
MFSTSRDSSLLRFAIGFARNHWLCWGLLAAFSPASTLGRSAGWQELFNGKDLTGWRHVGRGKDVVENGLLRTHGGSGVLYWSEGKFGNCVVRVVYRMRHHNDNSGIFIRMPEAPRVEHGDPVHGGYEVQIDNEPEASGEDEYHVTGTLYSFTKPLAKPGRPGPEWNTMEITLEGPRTIVTLNGVKVTDFTEGDEVPPKRLDFEPERGPRPLEGYLGLQNHSRRDVVFFKEIAIQRMSK